MAYRTNYSKAEKSQTKAYFSNRKNKTIAEKKNNYYAVWQQITRIYNLNIQVYRNIF